jgi:hypothetical protein
VKGWDFNCDKITWNSFAPNRWRSSAYIDSSTAISSSCARRLSSSILLLCLLFCLLFFLFPCFLVGSSAGITESGAEEVWSALLSAKRAPGPSTGRGKRSNVAGSRKRPPNTPATLELGEEEDSKALHIQPNQCAFFFFANKIKLPTEIKNDSSNCWKHTSRFPPLFLLLAPR